MTPGPEPLADGDWQALYRRLERSLFNLAYRYVWQREEAQDVVHDAFLRVWARRGTLRAETADRYLWVSVLNLARNRRRWKRLRGLFEVPGVAIEEHAGSDALEATLLQTERDALLRNAIDALPEKLREVLLLTEFSGCSATTSPRCSACQPAPWPSRRHLAVQRLRGRMRGENE